MNFISSSLTYPQILCSNIYCNFPDFSDRSQQTPVFNNDSRFDETRFLKFRLFHSNENDSLT